MALNGIKLGDSASFQEQPGERKSPLNLPLDVARKRFLDHPDRATYRRDFLAACVNAGDPDTLFRAAAAVLEQDRIPKQRVENFGLWLVDAIVQAARSEGGLIGAKACIQAARFSLNLLHNPEFTQEVLHEAFQLAPGADTAHQSIELLGDHLPTQAQIVWIDRLMSTEGATSAKAHQAARGAHLAADCGRPGLALRWAEFAAAHEDEYNALYEEIRTQVDELQASLGDQIDEARADPGRQSRSKALMELSGLIRDLDPGDPRVLELAKEAYEANSESSDIVGFLDEIYVDRNELEDLLELYREVLVETESRPLRLLAHRRLSQLYRDPLNNPEKAEIHLQKVLAIDPSDEHAFGEVTRVLHEAGDVERIIELHEKALRQRPERERAVILLEHVGELLWHTLQDLDRAEDAYRRLRSLDPHSTPALEFFEKLYESTGDYNRLYATLAQRLAQTDERAQRAQLAKEMARLATEHLEDPTRALESWKRALRDAPDDPDVQDAISALYQETGKWHALVDFINTQVGTLPDDEVDQKVALLFQLIEIYQSNERIPSEDMVTKTYRRIMDLSPTNVDALDSLAEKYEGKKRWRDLIQVLQQRIEVTDDALELLDLFLQVSDLWIERMSNPSQAIPFLERILELDRENMAVVKKLREIYRAKHNIEKLYETYERELSLEHKPESRKRVLIELAGLAQNRLHDPTRAIRYWEQVLDIDPESAPALSALWSLYTRQEHWESLLELLGRLLGRSDLSRKRRIELLERQGRVYTDQLEDHDRAREIFAEILEIAPANTFARNALRESYVRSRDWASLETFFQERGDWQSYIEFLDTQFSQTEDLELQADLDHEVARVYQVQLDNIVRAGERMAEALKRRPDDLKAARWLLEHCDTAGRLNERRSVIDRILEHTDESHERAQMLAMGMEVAIEEGAAERAVRYGIERLLMEATEYGSTTDLDALLELVGQTRTGAQLIEALNTASETLTEPSDRARYQRAAARLVDEYRSDPNEGIVCWQKILDNNPDDREGLDALERLFRAARQWEDLEGILQTKSNLLDGEEQVYVLKQLATLYEDILDQNGAALMVLRSAESVAPDDDDVRTAIRRLLRAEERFEELGILLEEDAEKKDGPERTRIHLRLIQLRTGPLHQPLAGLELIGVVFDEAPDFRDHLVASLCELLDHPEAALEAARLLRRVREATGDATKLAEVLDTLRTIETDSMARREATWALVELWERRLGEPLRAFELVNELISDFGPELDLIERAERLAQSPVLRERFLDLLRSLDGQVDLSHETMSDIRHRRARLLQEDTSTRVEACEVLEALLFDDPEDDEAATGLETLLVDAGDPEALLRFYQGRLDAAYETDEKIRLYRRMCGLLRDDLDRPEEAVDYYRSILLLDEENLPALQALEELYRGYERWEELLKLLDRKALLAPTRNERAALFHEMGLIARDRLDDTPRAIDELQRAIDEDPEFEDGFEALEQLLLRTDLPSHPDIVRRIIDFLLPRFQEQGRWEKMVYLHAMDAELQEDTSYRADQYAIIGKIWEERLNNKERAYEAYLRAMEFNPDAIEFGQLARAVALETGQLQQYVTLVEQLLRNGVFLSPAERHLEVGALYERHLNQLQRAQESYHKVLEIEPYHPEALRCLGRLHGTLEQPDQELEIYLRLLDLLGTSDERTQLHWQIAGAALRNDSVDRAVESLCYVADHPEHIEAEHLWEALNTLRSIYQGQGNVDDIRTVLDQLIEHAQDPKEKTDFIDEAVEAAEDAGDVVAAIEHQRQRVELTRDDIGAWKLLERLLEDAGNFPGLAETLRAEQAQFDDPTIREPCLLRLIDILSGPLGDSGEALSLIESELGVGEVSPGFLDKLAQRREDPNLSIPLGLALTRYLATTDQGWREANLWEALLSESPDEIDTIRAHERLIELYGGELADRAGGVRHSVALFVQAPHNEEMLAFLRQEFAEDPELILTAAEALEEKLATAITDQRSNARESLAAEVHQAGNLPLAIELQQRVADEDPSRIKTYDALASYLREAEDWDKLAEYLRQHCNLEPAPDRRQALLIELADVCWHGKNDLSEAEEALNRVLAENPGHKEAFVEARALAIERTDMAAEVELCQQRLDFADSDDEMALRLDLLNMLSEHLNDDQTALEHAETLLAMHSDNPTVRNTLLEFCERSPDSRLVLAPSLGDAFDTADEAESADRCLTLLAEIQEEDELAQTLRKQLALRRDQLDDTVRALQTSYALVACRPTDVIGYDDAAQLAQDLGEPHITETVTVLAATVMANATADSNWAPLAVRVARFAAEHKDPVRAVELFRAAVAASPDDLVIIDEMLDYCRDEGLDTRRVEVLSELAEDCPDGDRAIELLRDAADTLRTQLDDPGRAAIMLQRILDRAPTDILALERLEEIYQSMDDPSVLEELYEHWLGVADNEITRIDINWRYAYLLVDRVKDNNVALDRLEAILALDPSHEDTIGLLRSWARVENHNVGPELKRRAIDILDYQTKFKESDEDHAVLLQAKAFLSNTAEEKADHFEKLLELCEATAPDDAFAAACQALQADPGRQRIYESLTRLARDLDQQTALVGILIQLENNVDALDQNEAFEQLLGDALWDQDRFEEAALRYEIVADLGTADAAVLDRLESYLRDHELPERLSRILSQRAEQETDSEKRATVLRELGRVQFEQLGQLELARESLLRARQDVPNDRAVFELAETVLKALDDMPALEEIYRAEIPNTTDGEEAIRLQLAMAQTLDHGLDRPVEAAEYYEAVLATHPEDTELTQILDRIYTDSERWEELLVILKHSLTQTDDMNIQTAIHLRLGTMLWASLNRHEEALDYLRLVLSRNATDATAINTLEELLETGAVPVIQVASLLEPAYEELGQTDSLIELLYKELDEVTTATSGIEIRIQLAELLENKEDKVEEAFQQRILAIAGGADVDHQLEQLKTHAHETISMDQLAKALRENMDDVANPQLRIRLLHYTAELLETEIHSLPQATELLEQIRMEHPGDAKALTALRRIYDEMGEVDALVDVMAALEGAKGSDDPAGRVDLMVERATLQHRVLNNSHEAAMLLRTALMERPEHSGAIDLLEELAQDPEVFPIARETLEPLFRERADTYRLVRLYESGAAVQDTPEVRADLYRRAGEVLSEHNEDPLRILTLFLDSLKNYPFQEELLHQTLRLTQDCDAYEYAEAPLRELLDAGLAPDDEVAIREVLVKMAVDDTDSLRTECRNILDLKPDRLDIIERLLSMAHAQKDQQEILELCQMKLDLPLDQAGRIESLRAAALAAQALGQTDDTETFWQELLVVDPDAADALAALETIYDERDDHQALVEILDRRVELCRGTEAFVEIKIRLAELRTRYLEDHATASADLEDALAEESERYDIILMLADCYRTLDLHRRLYELLGAKADDCPDEAQRLQMISELAGLEHKRFSKTDDAITHYLQVLAINPGHDEAFSGLRDVYSDMGQSEELLVLLRTRHKGTKDDVEQGQLLSQIVSLRIENGDRDPSLITDLEEILRLDPENTSAMQHLGDLKSEQGDHSGAYDLYRRCLNIATNPLERTQFRRRLGILCAGELERPEEALEHLELVNANSPDDIHVFQMVESLYGEQHGYAKLIGLYETRLEQELNATERVELIARLARLYLVHESDDEAFMNWVEQGRELRPDHPELVKLLIQFYEAHKNTRELVPLLSWYVNYLEARRELNQAAQYAHQLARHHIDDNNWNEAAVYARMVNRYAPNDVEGVILLGEVLEHTEEWELARKLYEQALQLPEEPDDVELRTEVLYRVAHTSNKLNETAKALDCLQRCLERNSSHEKAKTLAQNLS